MVVSPWRLWRTCAVGDVRTKLIGKLSSHRRSKITLAVRERNLDAQLFFRALDFKAVRVMRNRMTPSRPTP